MMNAKNTLSIVALIAVASGSALFGELSTVVEKKDVVRIAGALAMLETLIEDEVQDAKELAGQDGAAEQQIAVEEVEAVAAEEVNATEYVEVAIEVVVI